jgi:exosortase A
MNGVWKHHLTLLGGTIALILLLFFRDAADMAAIWWTSSTFTHCLFILPLVGWLIWQRRDEVVSLTPRLWGPGLALVAAAGFAWILGEAAGVSLIRHASLVMMIQASVITLLGPAVTRGLMFPLFYLFFLVPFGEELVPPLQTITAKLCMIFLSWAGIPAHIEGVFITTPTGYFEVAEACAGVKFLVAMVAYGTLVANVCFRSWVRRIAFMALVLVVPILANGIRAYGTIHISALTSNDFAEGFDHIIYGWVFFAVVMAIVMGIAWKFFDRGIDDPWLGDPPVASTPRPIRWPLPAGLAAVLAIPMLWQFAQASLGQVPMPNQIALPEVAGWQRAETMSKGDWKPRFDGADHRLQGEYVNAKGDRVTLAIAVYAWQGDGKEMVGYAQGAADPDSHWSWTNDTPPPAGGKSERIFAPGLAREVASFYVVGGMTTGRAQIVKLATLKSRLIGGDQAAVAVLVSAEDRRDAPARPQINGFLAAMGAPERLAERLILVARGQ